MPIYKITRPGASHYAKVGGKVVRFNADPRLGENYIELPEAKAKSEGFSHLGLVPAPHITVDRAVSNLEVATPGSETRPSDEATTGPSSGGTVDPGGDTGDPSDVDDDPHGGSPSAPSAPSDPDPTGDKEQPREQPSPGPMHGAEKVALPEGWMRLNKARKAGLVRKITGENASTWSVQQLDTFLNEYENG